MILRRYLIIKNLQFKIEFIIYNILNELREIVFDIKLESLVEIVTDLVSVNSKKNDTSSEDDIYKLREAKRDYWSKRDIVV